MAYIDPRDHLLANVWDGTYQADTYFTGCPGDITAGGTKTAMLQAVNPGTFYRLRTKDRYNHRFKQADGSSCSPYAFVPSIRSNQLDIIIHTPTDAAYLEVYYSITAFDDPVNDLLIEPVDPGWMGPDLVTTSQGRWFISADGCLEYRIKADALTTDQVPIEGNNTYLVGVTGQFARIRVYKGSGACRFLEPIFIPSTYILDAEADDTWLEVMYQYQSAYQGQACVVKLEEQIAPPSRRPIPLQLGRSF